MKTLNRFFTFLCLTIMRPACSCPHKKIKVIIPFIACFFCLCVEKAFSLHFQGIEQLTQEEKTWLLKQSLRPKELLPFLHAMGYYHPFLVLPASLDPSQAKINLGPPTRLSTVVVEILEQEKQPTRSPELLAFVKNLPFKPGDRLSETTYEQFKQALLSHALHLGYLQARYIVNEIQVCLKDKKAHMHLVLHTGPQHFFGTVAFVDPPYPHTYLEKYTPFSRNEPYSVKKLLTYQKILTESDLFSKVSIDPQLESVDKQTVPIQVRLTPRPANRYTAGAGFGTDTGLRGSLGWDRRLTSLPGHRFHSEMRYSKKRSHLQFNYLIPGKQPATDRWALGLQGNREHLPDKKFSQRLEFSAAKIKKRETLDYFQKISFLSETFEEMASAPKKGTHFLLPSLGFTWATRQLETDEQIYQDGARLSNTLRGGLQSCFSTTNILQNETSFKYIKALSETFRLLLNGQLGVTTAKQFEKVPLSLRFFAGGDYSLRGYRYLSLGPQKSNPADDNKKVVIGGRHLLTGTLELERKINKGLSLATFLDGGNAFNHWRERFALSGGVGVRWGTPLGALRLDIAKPIILKQRKFRIHLTFGKDL